MNDLVSTLKQIVNDFPLENFEWAIPNNCPVDIPTDCRSGYEKNVHLKENFRSLIGNDPTLENHYWAIQEWGGIGSFKKTEKNNVRIKGFVEELGKRKLTRRSGL